MTCPSCLVTNKIQAPVTLSKHGLTPRPTPTPKDPGPRVLSGAKGAWSGSPPSLPASLPRSSLRPVQIPWPLRREGRGIRFPGHRTFLELSKIGSVLGIVDSNPYLAIIVLERPSYSRPQFAHPKHGGIVILAYP